MKGVDRCKKRTENFSKKGGCWRSLEQTKKHDFRGIKRGDLGRFSEDFRAGSRRSAAKKRGENGEKSGAKWEQKEEKRGAERSKNGGILCAILPILGRQTEDITT